MFYIMITCGFYLKGIREMRVLEYSMSTKRKCWNKKLIVVFYNMTNVPLQNISIADVFGPFEFAT